MSVISPLLTIPVGVLVERSKGAGPWSEFIWRARRRVARMQPEMAPWTRAARSRARPMLFYAGSADGRSLPLRDGALSRQSRDRQPQHLGCAQPCRGRLALRAGSAVTADPAEGEAFTERGRQSRRNRRRCRRCCARRLKAFVAEHHVEREFVKRKRRPRRSGGAGAASARRRCTNERRGIPRALVAPQAGGEGQRCHASSQRRQLSASCGARRRRPKRVTAGSRDPRSICRACRRSNSIDGDHRHHRVPAQRYSRRIEPCGPSPRLGQPIPPFATSSALPRTPGTSPIPPPCPGSVRSRAIAGTDRRDGRAGCRRLPQRRHGREDRNPRRR